MSWKAQRCTPTVSRAQGCLAAAYWDRIDRIVYANVRSHAATIGFADELHHRELAIPLVERTIGMEQLMRDEAQAVFVKWVSRQVVV
jgi:tRNA(Arg) A34 adenosine deaminase TadA